MQVFYRAESGTFEVVYERVGPVKFCCVGMCRAWGELIGFGVKGHARSTDRAVNLYALVPQAGREPVCGLTEVQFCPWCGEVVEPCRVK